MARAQVFARKTKETHIQGELNLDGTGKAEINTGIGFLDHMLELFAFHSGFDLSLTNQGDLHIDAHHSVEDIALALGEAMNQALGERKGIARYASFFLPMDECLVRTVLDLSGRPFHVFKGFFHTSKVGELPTEMVAHFFKSFADKAGVTLHQEILYGFNDHHLIEALFKGMARALRDAVAVVGDEIPSSKGVL